MSTISRPEYGMPDANQTSLLASSSQIVQSASSGNPVSNNNESDAANAVRSPNHEKLTQEIDRLNAWLKETNKSLRFKYNEKAQEFYVEVLDQSSQKVIETLPPKYLMDLSVKIKEIVGLYVDQKI